MKRDHKSANLILQESEKTEFGSQRTFLVFFFTEIERNTILEHPLNIRLGERKFFCFVFKCE